MNEDLKFRLRLLLFILLVLFMLIGPFYKQIINGKSYIFREWIMFSGLSFGIYDIQLTEHLKDGSKIPVNYIEKLKIKKKSNKNYWRVMNPQHVLRILKSVCIESQTSYPYISLKLKYATRKGWKVVHDNEENICNRNFKIKFR